MNAQEDLDEIEARGLSRPAGSCGGQFTANTMACVSEALGLALPHSAMRTGAVPVARRVSPYASGHLR